jgi:hypothetical protein
MNRIASYVLGPELIWAIVYALTALLVSRNNPPTLAGNQRLELIGWFLPVVSTLLAFTPLWWAPGNRWLWLLRIVVVGCIAIVVVVALLCGGIDYKDSRNSGVGTAFVMFVMLGYMVLWGGALVATILFFVRSRAENG